MVAPGFSLALLNGGVHAALATSSRGRNGVHGLDKAKAAFRAAWSVRFRWKKQTRNAQPEPICS
jgi:hypothetical protein